MKRLLVAGALSLAALGFGAAPALATNECRGLMVCIPVAGPWVVVPTGRVVPRPTVEFQLSCPRGYIVGGLDAELSDQQIDVNFQAKIGAPVNPGISTSRAAVFMGMFVGTVPRAPTFRPHIGCMPASGGGIRIPTAASKIFPPGEPTIRHVKTTFIGPRTGRVAVACNAGGRLVAGAHALGFFTVDPPSIAVVNSVRGTRSIAGNHVAVRVRTSGNALGFSPIVQVSAVCAGEGR